MIGYNSLIQIKIFSIVTINSTTTMQIKVLHLAAAAVALACIPGCSLKEKTTAKLKPGKVYELRKAGDPNTNIAPHEIRSVYFVLKPDDKPQLGGLRSVGDGSLNVRTTAYCHSESDHLIYGRRNAIGTPLRYGVVRSAAADWSRFPLGTRFRCKSQPGVVYEVDDYGSALVGTNTIDIYCPSQRLMNQWGVKHLDIEIVQWGSYSKSAQILRDRVAYRHVRQMLSDIQTRPDLAASFDSTARSPFVMARYPVP
jgi:3D (Asp-Asp-Asp) domain-containing protein